MPGLVRFLLTHPLTRRSRLAAIARLVGWQIRCRLNDEIIVPWVGGTKLAVRRGMRGATGNIYAGLHEFADMSFVLHFLRPGDLFLDVGANVGTYTVLASGVCGARTSAFEPDPVTSARLRRNIEINAIEDLVSVQVVALGAGVAEVNLTIGRDTMNRIAGPSERDVRPVRQLSLDAAIDRRPVTMIKLDVEGYELEVLKGAERCLANPALNALETEGISEPIVALLARHGFERVHYDPFHRTIRDAPTSYPSANALFVRDRDAVAARLRDAPPVHVLGHRI